MDHVMNWPEAFALLGIIFLLGVASLCSLIGFLAFVIWIIDSSFPPGENNDK